MFLSIIPARLHRLPKTLTLIIIQYSTSHNYRRRRQRRNQPPAIDPSALSTAVAQLPARFTPSDLENVIENTKDPRIAPQILSWALNNHTLRLRSIDGAGAPFLAVIKRLGAAGLHADMDAAVSLTLSIPTLTLTAEPHFNTIIYFYCQARKISKAIYVYKRMRDSDDPAVRPNNDTYNMLFTNLVGGERRSSYIHHLNMEAIRMLFRQMVNAGVAPDRIALNSVVKGYSLSVHMNDALRVFHQMEPLYGVEPDVNTYDYLVLGLCKQGRTRNARELFEEMMRKGMVPCKRVCNALVSAVAIAGEVEAAAEVMWVVARKGRAVDRITCRALLEETCRHRKVEDAMKLLREMGEKEMVDGWLYRELMHYIQDELGDASDSLVCQDNLSQS